MEKLFVVPYNGELPESFGIKKLDGDLVDKLSHLRNLDGVLGAYAALTPDELALLVEKKTIINSPELVMITDLGVDYPASLLLYAEFMDVLSIHELEEFLKSEGLVNKDEDQGETGFMGVKNTTPSKQVETYLEP